LMYWCINGLNFGETQLSNVLMKSKIAKLVHAYHHDTDGTWSHYLAARIANEVANEMALKGEVELHALGLTISHPMAVVAYLRKCEPTPDTLTPPQIAKMCRVRIDTVLGWIRSGKLKA